jgi:hypothetical protein
MGKIMKSKNETLKTIDFIEIIHILQEGQYTVFSDRSGIYYAFNPSDCDAICQRLKKAGLIEATDFRRSGRPGLIEMKCIPAMLYNYIDRHATFYSKENVWVFSQLDADALVSHCGNVKNSLAPLGFIEGYDYKFSKKNGIQFSDYINHMIRFKKEDPSKSMCVADGVNIRVLKTQPRESTPCDLPEFKALQPKLKMLRLAPELQEREKKHTSEPIFQPQLKPLIPAAVLSIQCLDGQKVAFSSTDVDDYYLMNQKSDSSLGLGHSGFAIAKALGAPYVTVRSAGKRQEQNKVLTGHVVDDAWIIVTGHSSQGKDISGTYCFINQGGDFEKQIVRGPNNIQQTVMEAGLTAESHINIMLCICYGAQNEENLDGTEKENTSFAFRLAKQFAESGISTTIIASDAPVNRFGPQQIVNHALTFNESVGIASKNICIFNTIIVNQKMQLQSFKPVNQTIFFNKEGVQNRTDKPIEFANLKCIEIDLSAKLGGTKPRLESQSKLSAHGPLTTHTSSSVGACTESRSALLASSLFAGKEKLNPSLPDGSNNNFEPSSVS